MLLNGCHAIQSKCGGEQQGNPSTAERRGAGGQDRGGGEERGAGARAAPARRTLKDQRSTSHPSRNAAADIAMLHGSRYHGDRLKTALQPASDAARAAGNKDGWHKAEGVPCRSRGSPLLSCRLVISLLHFLAWTVPNAAASANLPKIQSTNMVVCRYVPGRWFAGRTALQDAQYAF